MINPIDIKAVEWIMKPYEPPEIKKQELSEYQKIINWFIGQDIPSVIQKVVVDAEIDAWTWRF